ncbi:pentapeptide repeat-containing protein [Streptomyces sp. NPDC006197]|uniref:pentapeptide repeat-containing protein n=1 Tax=Streptomyces sp. NPDC006197 TaxID=3156685 RepID=UPI0033AE99E5
MTAVLLALAAAFLLLALARMDALPTRSTAVDWLGRWWPVLLSGVSVVAAIVIWRRRHGPNGPRESSETGARTDRWSQLPTFITTFTALAALVFTALSLRATHDQISVAEQGQITDRYTKAIDQLGAPGPDHLQIRLGGIYALERLASDSPRDQQTIVEVLSAFIRTTSPRTTPSKICPTVAADVQAAFIVLSRRDVLKDPSYRSPHPFGAVDLRHTCLAGVEANGANLTRMSLVGSDLHGANLSNAHGGLMSLVDATLTGTYLDGADLSSYVFLDRADFTGASLSEAKIGPSRLRGVKLVNADLEGADLHAVDFHGVDLTGARHDEKTDTTGATRDATTIGAWW